MQVTPIGGEQFLRLPGKIPMIGTESIARRGTPDGIGLYVSPDGSYRYLRFVDNIPVSALQVVTRDGKLGLGANVFTQPIFRRRGYARELWAAAAKDFVTLQHSKYLTADGQAWAAAITGGSSG